MSADRAADPRFQPHVLVITETEPGEKEWEIEHPRHCPRVCRWFPGAREVLAEEQSTYGDLSPDPAELDCYVAWEIANAGLDGLDVTEAAGWSKELSPLEQWRLLAPGRYLLEGWHTPFHWAGSEPCDADGGIVLLGPEPK
jgi:hypothetical protein